MDRTDFWWGSGIMPNMSRSSLCISRSIAVNSMKNDSISCSSTASSLLLSVRNTQRITWLVHTNRVKLVTCSGSTGTQRKAGVFQRLRRFQQHLICLAFQKLLELFWRFPTWCIVPRSEFGLKDENQSKMNEKWEFSFVQLTAGDVPAVGALGLATLAAPELELRRWSRNPCKDFCTALARKRA